MLKRLGICITALVTVLGLTATHPYVYWTARGWLTNEPTWNGFPSSYWRQQLKYYAVTVRRYEPGELRGVTCSYSFSYLPKTPDLTGRILIWINAHFGGPSKAAKSTVLDMSFEPQSLPVLLNLTGDDDPTIRAWAALDLGALGSRFPDTKRRSLATLRRMPNDTGELDGDLPKVTVGQIMADHIAWLMDADSR